MKVLSIFILFCTFFLSASLMDAQNILVADNNLDAPSGAHVYSSLSAAITAAVDDDIIHVIPSPTTYGSITLNKRLNIYGIGYTPDTENGYRSVVNYIYMADGSSGSLISGMWMTQTSVGIQLLNGSTLSDVVIENCRLCGIWDVGGGVVSNMTIKNNILTGVSGGNPTGLLAFNTALGSTSDILISNNIISGHSYTFTSSGAISASNYTVIANNLFTCDASSSREAFISLTNCIVTNNIFHGLSTGGTAGTSFYNNSFVNNISFAAPDMTLPPLGINGANSGYGNQENVDPMMTNVGLHLHWNFNDLAELLPGSPALAAGNDGFDIGLSGGAYPFKFDSHGTPLPYIHELNNSGMAIEGQDLTITATARSNQ